MTRRFSQQPFMLKHNRALRHQFVDVPLRAPIIRSPFDYSDLRHILVTAPHAAEGEARTDTLYDPLSADIATQIARLMRCELVVAHEHRSRGDQNRFAGLMRACDMVVPLFACTPSHQTLHLDIHTYTRNMPPPGWGSGLNIIVLHKDAVQKNAAHRFASAIACVCPVLCPAVIEMPRRTRSWTDDNANALTEWSRANGAMSLLLEFPVDCIDPAMTGRDSGWVPSFGLTTAQLAAYTHSAIRAEGAKCRCRCRC